VAKITRKDTTVALNVNDAIKAILKTWYKDGVENLLFRNSPVVKKIKKTRVEGKEQAFSALYSSGGAVGANYNKAKARAAVTSRNVEFKVTPGQLFSCYSMNQQEVQASLSKKGAYMKVAGNKMFAANESLRKMLAGAFYGNGHGLIGSVAIPAGDGITWAANATQTFTVQGSCAMKLAVGMGVVFTVEVGDESDSLGPVEVTAISGTSVTFKNTTAASISLSAATTYYICYEGSTDTSDNPLLPMGLAGWLPYVGSRTGDTWTAYIGTSFFGVNRSVNVEALAGNFYKPAASEDAFKTVEELIRRCRRYGSQADMIVMNDADWKTVAQSTSLTNAYVTNGLDKKVKQTKGTSTLNFAFSTSWIENVYDDPYCPEGVFYVLDMDTIELWTYTNVEKFDNDGIAGNEPGKPEIPDVDGDEKHEMGLIFDDILNVQPGSGSDNGPDVLVSLSVYGSFVVLNPSVNGVGIFYNQTPLGA
jgi:hypothetical protein